MSRDARITSALFVLWGCALFGLACAAPARMGLTRIQVCVNAETGQRYDVVVPRATRGASVCADFEAGAE